MPLTKHYNIRRTSTIDRREFSIRSEFRRPGTNGFYTQNSIGNITNLKLGTGNPCAGHSTANVTPNLYSITSYFDFEETFGMYY